MEVQQGVASIEGGTDTRTSWLRTLASRREHATVIVRRTFLAYAGRPATPAEITTWSDRLMGGLSVAELPIEVAATPAGLTRSAASKPQLIDAIYAAFVDRAPTDLERARGVRSLDRGEPLAGIARTLHGSTRGRALRVSSSFLEVLGREPTAAEMTTWQARLPKLGDRELAIALMATEEYLQQSAQR